MNQKHSKKITRRQAVTATLGAASVAAIGTTQSAAAPHRDGALKGKRVLVSVGEFSEGLETYYMVYRLIEEGIKPIVVAADVKRLQLVVHDFEPQYTNYTEKLGYFIETDADYKSIDPSDFDGLLIPGGRGPEETRQYSEVLEMVGHFIDKNLPLGAMCHGPQLIYAARPVKGRRIAAYGGIRADIELAGAEFIDEPVVVDGRMVTSRGWPDLPYFMAKFLNVLAKN